MRYDQERLQQIIEMRKHGISTTIIGARFGITRSRVQQILARFAPEYKKTKLAAPNYRKRPLCSIEGCGRPHKGHGLCELHKTRKEKGIPMDKKNITQNKGHSCACGKPARSLGLCQNCYAALVYQRNKFR